MDLSLMMIALSCMGDELIYLLITSILVIMRRDLGIKILTTLLITMYLNQTLKFWFNIPRPADHLTALHSLPPLIKLLVGGEGPSFPSGHAQISSTFWTSLTLNVPSKTTATTMVVLPILIAYSRIALGVHTPLDVVVALIIGYSIPLITNLTDVTLKKCGSRYEVPIKLSLLTSLLIFSVVVGYPKLALIAGLMVAGVIAHKLTLDSGRSFTKRLGTSALSLVTLASGYALLDFIGGLDNAVVEFAVALVIGITAYIVIPVKLNVFKIRWR
ncbi:MAG: phosphatase PAP2 family protein [Sulfolobales archaeon]